ncbi:MAG TPA: phosphoribosylamine--glycine ligase [Patescibacteria group bacterium]
MNKKNVLVIDSGARGHVLAELLTSSPSVDRVRCYPGNGGTDQFCEPIKSTVKLDNPHGLLDIASMFNIDLTVVGPELPAVHGVADAFKDAKKLIICPNKTAAQLEDSKIYAKLFMVRHGIPTADFDVYYCEEDVWRFAVERNWKCVIKANGLCGGKGAYVCTTKEEVKAVIAELFGTKVHGAAGEKGVVEDLLLGVETSFFILADGKTFVECGTAGDHKRAFDHDQGPNTGGMGAFWPCPYTDEAMRQKILGKIVDRTIAGMLEEGRPFTGFLYVGVMLTADGPKVLEYNVRFGDPEAQVVIPSIDTDKIDSYELLKAAATGNLGKIEIPWRAGVRVGVVLATGNYPGKERGGFKAKITGPIRMGEAREDVLVYHAATVEENGEFFATPGRVLTVSAPGSNYENAIDRAYRVVNQIEFEGMRCRSDIGKRAMLIAS